MNKLFLIIIAILSLVGAPVWASQTTSFGPTTVLGNATISAASGGGVAPTFVQQCTTSIGGGGASAFQIVLGSGGTTNCTTPFTPGDSLLLDYTDYAPTGVTDWTTGLMSSSGVASLTWHKEVSGIDSTGVFYDGTFAAFPTDIVTPTSAITITLTPGGSSTFSAVTITEIHLNSNALDQFVTLKTGASSPNPILSNTSSALGTALEYADVVSRTNGSVANLTAGACFGGTCTLPHSTSNPDIDFNSEYFITSATTAGTGSYGSATGLLYSAHVALFK